MVKSCFLSKVNNFLKICYFYVKKFPKNWVFQKIIGVPKFCSKINGEFCFGAFCELLQGLEVQNKSNTMRTPLWPLGKEFRWFQRVVHSKLSIWRHNRSLDQFFWAVQYFSNVLNFVIQSTLGFATSLTVI